MSRNRRYAACALVLILAGAWPSAQVAQDTGLTQQIERIFASGAYAVPRFGPARWLPDGTAYAIVERSTSAPSGFDIVRYDAATGARTVVMPAARLVPPGATAPLAIDDYAWSARRHTAAHLHQHAQGLARQHARRLLGAGRGVGHAEEAGRQRRPSRR